MQPLQALNGDAQLVYGLVRQRPASPTGPNDLGARRCVRGQGHGVERRHRIVPSAPPPPLLPPPPPLARDSSSSASSCCSLVSSSASQASCSSRALRLTTRSWYRRTCFSRTACVPQQRHWWRARRTGTYFWPPLDRAGGGCRGTKTGHCRTSSTLPVVRVSTMLSLDRADQSGIRSFFSLFFLGYRDFRGAVGTCMSLSIMLWSATYFSDTVFEQILS